jgi:hypothetical protein
MIQNIGLSGVLLINSVFHHHILLLDKKYSGPLHVVRTGSGAHPATYSMATVCKAAVA